MAKHGITNDFALDAVKDNFKPPKMGDMREDNVKELLERLGLSFDAFYKHVYDNSEYHIDKGHNFYYIKDITFVIKASIK